MLKASDADTGHGLRNSPRGGPEGDALTRNGFLLPKALNIR